MLKVISSRTLEFEKLVSDFEKHHNVKNIDYACVPILDGNSILHFAYIEYEGEVEK